MIFKANILRSCINWVFLDLRKCPNRSVHQICASTNDEQVPVIQLNEKFAELARSDGDKDKIAEIIQEYVVAKNFGKRVPSNLDTEHMEELMILPSKSQRKKYLSFLYKKEGFKVARIRKKELKEGSPKNRTRIEDSHIRYGLGFNTLFLAVRKPHIKKLYERHHGPRMLFSQKIVLDLDYDDFMMKRESKNCAYQLCLINQANRFHADPFNLYFCNADRSKCTVQYLEKSMPNIWRDDCLITCCSSSYLDIFPKEKLVYLSPHADEVMKHYDHEAIYIIGGFVDKTNQTPVSFEKAKREGIRSCRLPLDDHVEWKAGSKSLTLDQMVNILLELKVSNDWKKAFRFLPERKITERSLEETRHTTELDGNQA